ncbi:hypothetical protein WG68_14300 [Arsukibacterium ikkense]|uniref:Uncharacterized protein n=1 Tax=Arsukibacterium ikkense TaxID=336831 RepID=A0A0M2V6C9_9GAMM|nr:hypothetical protein [Arsukibacterium ikkense]KKO44713.1 hypothetical protein WG68_14300 [Arsukibacterium ikkense]
MLLQTSNLPTDYKVIAELNYVLYEKQRLFIAASSSDVVFIIKTPSPYPNHEDEPGLLVFQTEFPKAAAAWIVDTIESRLWRSAAEGGEPSGKNSVREQVAGETLTLRRTMAVGDDRDKGFILINSSRKSVNFDEDFQEIEFSDRLLKEGGLLDVLRRL